MWAKPGDSCGLKTLWTDAPDALRQLDAFFTTGSISAAERDDLAHFIDHGWLVWRNAIEPGLVDAFVNDIQSHHRHPGKFVTTNHRNGVSQLKLSGTVSDRFESLFDLYVNLESARAVCFHPRIIRFLSLIFRSRPVAIQQLLFQRSNGHLVHQDTSVVAVEDPLLMTASWIALEDVVEGSGELAFYDGSHKLPHYLFKNGTKRMDFAVDSGQDYTDALEKACREADMPYERFLARKGDVFLWAADLVHRSHPRQLPDGTSRLSCVTHYHPATTQPFWFRFHPERTALRSHNDLAAYTSSHYPLGGDATGMVTPYPK